MSVEASSRLGKYATHITVVIVILIIAATILILFRYEYPTGHAGVRVDRLTGDPEWLDDKTKQYE